MLNLYKGDRVLTDFLNFNLVLLRSEPLNLITIQKALTTIVQTDFNLHNLSSGD